MFTGCIVGIKSSGGDRLIGKFQSEADYDAVVEAARSKRGIVTIQVCGYVKGREVNREMTIREAERLSQ